ncbi:MAG: cell division protein FtsL [Nitrospirae bacterium]|nr:cell division protein FtsL [Candidatus Manganitrophaceae bacterium]
MRRFEFRLVFLVLGGAILLLAFLSLWQRNQMIHLGYEIEQLHQQKVELQRIHRGLMVEAESLRAIERVEQIAIQQLKMSPALPQQRVYLQQEKEIGGRSPDPGKGGRRND